MSPSPSSPPAPPASPASPLPLTTALIQQPLFTNQLNPENRLDENLFLLLNMKKLFFIALLPPQTIQDSIMEIKQHCADVYQSKAALKSPPHITLQSPFKSEVEAVPILEESLKSFAKTRKPVPISLKGFGAFKPRVIYVNVLKTPELIAIQKDLMAYLEDSLGIVDERSKNRPFSPHVTVAFRDLKRQNFRKAWTEFENQPLDFEFMASHLTLLLHDGRRWNVSVEFPFLTG